MSLACLYIATHPDESPPVPDRNSAPVRSDLTGPRPRSHPAVWDRTRTGTAVQAADKDRDQSPSEVSETSIRGPAPCVAW